LLAAVRKILRNENRPVSASPPSMIGAALLPGHAAEALREIRRFPAGS
jgi:hypothetical protein